MGVGILFQAICIKTPGQTDLGSFHEQRSRDDYVEASSPHGVKGLRRKMLANVLQCENSSTRRLLEKQDHQTLPTMTCPSFVPSLSENWGLYVLESWPSLPPRVSSDKLGQRFPLLTSFQVTDVQPHLENQCVRTLGNGGGVVEDTPFCEL